MSDWVLLLVAGVGGLAVLLVLARYRHHQVVKDWTGIMDPGAAEALAQVEQNAALDQRMMSDAWAQALAAQERKEWQEAVRLLELAWWVLDDATPSRLQRLRSMSQICRQVAAVLPLPAARPADFRMARLRGLAGLGAILHAVLVSPAERLAMRARVLVAAFQLLLWTARRAKVKAAARPEPGAAWRTFDSALADWKTADRAHLESYRAAMMTLAAELRREVPVSLG